MNLDAEIVIVGAGPAGATAALMLAPLRDVVVLERNVEPAPRIGESLPGAARRLFRDMGLLDSFLAEGHAPAYGNRSVWGDDEPVERDALRDPDGHGWHLDRVRFERWLRAHALARGARFAFGTLDRIERDGDAWIVNDAIRAKLVIDAGGRSAPAARRFGAVVRAEDRLVCSFVYGRDGGEGARGITYVEAVEDGWWYSAPMPDARRVLAFHTDADLPVARAALLSHVPRELGELLEDAGFVADDASSFVAAHSAFLDPCAGDGYLAAGDAAIAFDPLSSQGLLNALFTGLAAAEAADAHLRGDADALARYKDTIAGIYAAYREHLQLYYGMERRWSGAPFWQRRNRMSAITAAGS